MSDTIPCPGMFECIEVVTDCAALREAELQDKIKYLESKIESSWRTILSLNEDLRMERCKVVKLEVENAQIKTRNQILGDQCGLLEAQLKEVAKGKK